jgi:hypothetical protein
VIEVTGAVVDAEDTNETDDAIDVVDVLERVSTSSVVVEVAV